MSRTTIGALAVSLLALPAPTMAGAPQSAPSSPTVSASGEPAATLELRRRFLDPVFMPLTFHAMDGIFHTQSVAAAANPARLPRAERPLDFSFEYDGRKIAAGDVFEDTYTNALIIVKNGRIVYERYRNLTNPQTRFVTMSMAKSITSLLAGIAVDRGDIRSLDDQVTVYIPELKGSAYDGVTVRDVIDMKTGVDRSDGEQLKPGTEGAQRREQIFVRNGRPAVDEAFMVKRKVEPGKVWDYTTLNATVLGWIVERATHQPLTQFTTRMLWQPLGAESPAYWMVDGPGPGARPLTGVGFNATLRDYARIGLMMLNKGRFNGKQILSAKWVAESTGEPHVPAAPNFPRGYQHMWWTVPGQPAYMADGLGGQYIYVDPVTQTVIVKLSYVPMTDRKAAGETFAFFRAASAWKAQ